MSIPVDALLLAAIPNEVDQITKDLGNPQVRALGRASVLQADLQLGSLRLNVAFTAAGSGQTSITAIVCDLLQHFSPRIVLMIGCAGGIKDVEIGDVVCAERVTDPRGKTLAYGERADYGFAHRGNGGLVQLARVVAMSRAWDDGKPYRVEIGEILSGVDVETDPVTVDRLKRSHPKALGVETEGYGFMEGAAGSPQIPALVLRGISDMCANKAEADAENWQQRSTRRAWHFAQRLMTEYFSDPKHRQRLRSDVHPAPQIPRLPTNYLPRSSVVEALCHQLAQQDSAIHLLQGPPGLGKTCMAIEFARSGLASRAVRWLPLGPHVTPLQAGIELLNACGIEDAVQALTFRELQHLGRNRPELDDIIVVLDDAWDAALPSGLAMLLGSRTQLLVTTRLPRVADALDSPIRFILPPLTRAEAHLLFNSHAEQALSQQEIVTRYLDTLQGIPLSLRVAGRLFAHRLRDRFTPAEVIAQLAIGSPLLDQRVRDVSRLAEELEPTLRQIVARSIEGLSVAERSDFLKLAPLGASQQRFTLTTLEGLWNADPRSRAARLVEMGVIERIGEEFSMHAAFGWIAQELSTSV